MTSAFPCASSARAAARTSLACDDEHRATLVIRAETAERAGSRARQFVAMMHLGYDPGNHDHKHPGSFGLSRRPPASIRPSPSCAWSRALRWWAEADERENYVYASPPHLRRDLMATMVECGPAGFGRLCWEAALHLIKELRRQRARCRSAMKMGAMSSHLRRAMACRQDIRKVRRRTPPRTCCAVP